MNKHHWTVYAGAAIGVLFIATQVMYVMASSTGY